MTDNMPMAEQVHVSNRPEQLAAAAAHILQADIGDLRMIPAAALKLVQLIHDHTSRSGDLSRIIETEPALAVKVLKVVNSAAHGLPNKVLSIHQAVTLLGFSAIHQIATEQMLYGQLIKSGDNQRFDQLVFWQHCLFVANLSKQIAIDLGYPRPDIIYTGGLLHDIGKLMLEDHGKITYSDFLRGNGKNGGQRDHNERSYFGLTHAELGQVFCLNSNLPPVITAIIGYHHDLPPPDSPHAEFAKETAIICFADYIAWLHDIGSSKKAAGPILPEQVAELIDFDGLNFENLLLRVDREMNLAGRFYGMEFPDIQKIRANLLHTALKISQNPSHRSAANSASSSLTSPHHSLDPRRIIPATLEAIHNDFNFDRIIMFGMSAKRQSLLAKYRWPPTGQTDPVIPMAAIGGRFLECFRERTPLIIDSDSDYFGQGLLKLMGADSFIAVPVSRQNRLVGMLYVDNAVSKNPIDPNSPRQILPVANELGVALFNAQQYKIAKKQAEIDALSKLFNKGKIDQLLIETYSQSPGNLDGLAIGFVDIDRFKTFNDICGHQAGDDALKIVAQILGGMSRPDDFVGRYGGEEFLFALRNTNRDGALGYAERIRAEIEKQGKVLSSRFHDLALTVSIGVALRNPRFSTYAEHVEAADKAMYMAKNQGRNRVVILE